MRIKLFFELEHPTLDIQYRKGIISFIKHALQQYDEKLYLQLYDEKNTTMKTFTFAPILPKPVFSKEEVKLSEKKFQIVFSFYNYAYALHTYNSFVEQKFKKFSLNKNSMTLQKIVSIPEKEIEGESIIIKMSSPLVVRNHNRETLKDMYYSFERAEFKEYLRINIQEQMKNENLDTSLLDGFDIEAINARKTVVPLYEKMIECSIGAFRLIGNPKLLDYLYKAGVRSEKGDGIRLVWNNLEKGGRVLETLEIRLNNFLFNSGVLGFYKILEHSDKTQMLAKEENVIKVNPEVFVGFENDYISAMINEYEEDTRWLSIVGKKYEIQSMKLEEKEEQEKLNDFIAVLKKTLESASYKSGYEIVKSKGKTEDIYKYLGQIKSQVEMEEKRRISFENNRTFRKKQRNILYERHYIQQNKYVLGKCCISK